MGLRGELLLALVVGLCLSGAEVEAQLQIGFYASTCPQAEYIVRDEVSKAIDYYPGLAAGLLRMHFHDCFVRGCDGSVLIDSNATNTAEKESRANKPSLRGFEVIDSAKARLEASCSGVVSCADILAFAARDSVVLPRLAETYIYQLTIRRKTGFSHSSLWSMTMYCMLVHAQSGGFGYQVPAGRRDGRVSLASETSTLPPPTFDVDQLTQNFADKGLTQDEMVTLSGAHTIGRSHCTSFSKRLYNFSTTVNQDPAISALYESQLKQQCPQGSNGTVLMDSRTPFTLDNNYYNDILTNRGLFTSDQTLLSDNATAASVMVNAYNAVLWRSKFRAAMVKMGQIGVVTGSNGEIRLNCRLIN